MRIIAGLECPTCSKTVIHTLSNSSMFEQWICTNPAWPDFNALVVVEKISTAVLFVQRNDPLAVFNSEVKA